MNQRRHGHQSQHEPRHFPHQAHQGMHTRHRNGHAPNLASPQPTNPSQQSTDSYSHASVLGHTSYNNEVNPLTLLANALEPYADRGPSPRTSTLAPHADRPAEPLYSVPGGASGSSNPSGQLIDDGQQGGSHGTLMLSTRGRSKYLGPTAGSEWLKEVTRPTTLRYMQRAK